MSLITEYLRAEKEYEIIRKKRDSLKQQLKSRYGIGSRNVGGFHLRISKEEATFFRIGACRASIPSHIFNKYVKPFIKRSKWLHIEIKEV